MRRVFLITGAPGSGTSLCAAIMERLGIPIDCDRREDENHPLGNYESDFAARVNQMLLGAEEMNRESEKHDWKFDIPAQFHNVEDAQKEIRRYLASVEWGYQYEVWGFKNPQTTITLDVWLDEIRENGRWKPWVVFCDRDERKAAETCNRMFRTKHSVEEWEKVIRSKYDTSVHPNAVFDLDAIREAGRSERERMLERFAWQLFAPDEEQMDRALEAIVR